MSVISEAFELSMASLENPPFRLSLCTDCTIWVGLSAGVDSTVLLHALSLWIVNSKKQTPFKIKAIHVHHGLSSNADDWASQAQSLCDDLNVSHHLDIECIVERVDLDNARDGIEQAARKARYGIFEKYCQDNDILLQGHHLDDQFETFFMRALRGSGLTGLSGIPKNRKLSRQNQCQIMRPLLMVEKKQIIEYAKENQLSWVEDESNQSSQFERNWWRNELLPQIWQRYPEKKQALSRTINNVVHEQSLLQQLIIDRLSVNRLEDNCEENKKQEACVDARIHPALNKIPRFDLGLIERLGQSDSLSYLRAWLAQYVDILPSSIQMQSIYCDMIQARDDAEPSIRWVDNGLYRYRNALFLLKDNELSASLKQVLAVSQTTNWQEEGLSCTTGILTCSEEVDGIALKPGRYHLRFWQQGDVAKPYKRSTRKMKKWWQDYSVPSWARSSWPLIIDNDTGTIAAVPGLFVCQGFQSEGAGEGRCYQWCFSALF